MTPPPPPLCGSPGTALAAALDAANDSTQVSDVVSALELPRGTTLGAVISPSAQRSQSDSDPRLFLTSPDGCTIYTFTLLGDSLEVGVVGQRAELPLPSGDLNQEDSGEILASFAPFPRTTAFTARASISHEDQGAPRGDSLGCTGCHVDPPHLQYGQKDVTVAGATFAALVLPMSGETGGLCVPQDLQRLRDCKCAASPPPAAGCENLPEPAPTPGSEACKRLDAVLALAPTADPQHAGSPADCARSRR